jgi:membrane associated rhomboid family serine protease
MLIYGSEVQRDVFPWANLGLMAIMAAVFWMELRVDPNQVRAHVFDPVSGNGVLTAVFLHASLGHLIGNLMVMCAFGNAVTNRLGNIGYAVFFVLCGVFANIFYSLFETRGALGASGAIMGVVAAFLVLYPLHDIKALIFWYRVRIASFWIILAWIAFDLIGAVRGTGHVAYHAHLGGALFGIAWTVAAVYLRFIRAKPREPTFMSVFLGIKDPTAAGDVETSVTKAVRGTKPYWDEPITTRREKKKP